MKNGEKDKNLEACKQKRVEEKVNNENDKHRTREK
jgi:hypothetical protein